MMNFSMLMLVAAMTSGQSDASPLVKSETFSGGMQWKAIEASPRIHVKVGETGRGSSVIVAVKDGFAYALTAAHVIQEGAVIEVDLFARAKYPTGDRTISSVKVFEKSTTADV